MLQSPRPWRRGVRSARPDDCQQQTPAQPLPLWACLRVASTARAWAQELGPKASVEVGDTRGGADEATGAIINRGHDPMRLTQEERSASHRSSRGHGSAYRSRIDRQAMLRGPMDKGGGGRRPAEEAPKKFAANLRLRRAPPEDGGVSGTARRARERRGQRPPHPRPPLVRAPHTPPAAGRCAPRPATHSPSWDLPSETPSCIHHKRPCAHDGGAAAEREWSAA